MFILYHQERKMNWQNKTATYNFRANTAKARGHRVMCAWLGSPCSCGKRFEASTAQVVPAFPQMSREWQACSHGYSGKMVLEGYGDGLGERSPCWAVMRICVRSPAPTQTAMLLISTREKEETGRSMSLFGVASLVLVRDPVWKTPKLTALLVDNRGWPLASMWACMGAHPRMSMHTPTHSYRRRK